MTGFGEFVRDTSHRRKTLDASTAHGKVDFGVDFDRSEANNPLKYIRYFLKNGAAYVTRTRDPVITNDVLYQLS